MTTAKKTPLPCKCPEARRTGLCDCPVKYSEGSALARVLGVEIFARGKHRDTEYTDADLDQIVSNFRRFSCGAKPLVTPTVVIGHEEEQSLLDNSGIPSVGRPERVWREGGILKADFAEVPPTIARLINGRAYRKVSAEIYARPPEGVPGKGKMLRRIALLGGALPHIKSLADLPLADYAEHDQALTPPVVLTFHEAKSAPDGAYVSFFSEVRPLDRSQLLTALTTAGLDIAAVTDTIPDALLAAALKGTEPAPERFSEPPPEPEDEEGMRVALMERFKKYTEKHNGKCLLKMEEMPRTTPAKPPEKKAMQYTEADIQKLITDGLVAGLAEIRKEHGAKLEQLDKFAEERVQADKRSTITARLQALVAAGKVLPAELDAGLADTVFALDSRTVRKYAEAGKEVETTDFDRFFKVLEARPILIKFAERVKAGDGKAPTAAGDEAEKVRAHAHKPEIVHALRAAGSTPEQYVAKFTELQKQRPEVTATQYGVTA